MSYVALNSPRRLLPSPGRNDGYFNTSSSRQQQRNFGPPVSSSNVYSPSPQLSLSSELASGDMTNPYQHSYGYAPGAHDPPGFAFPPQGQHYRAPQMQTQPPLPSPQPIPQHSPQSLQSHPASRKRRASEVDNAGSRQNAAAFGQGPGVMAGSSDPDLGLGASSSSQARPPNRSSGPAKKGRTNTPWTPAEEGRLKAMRDAGSSWGEIAKTFPTRTEGSVKKHWYKDMHYAQFAEDESVALLQAIKDYETSKWKVIGQKVGKPAKACEQFAKEQGWKV